MKLKDEFDYSIFDDEIRQYLYCRDLQDIPLELLLLIVKCLRIRDVVRLALTCKHLYKIIFKAPGTRNHFWKAITGTLPEIATRNPSYLMKYVQKQGRIQDITTGTSWKSFLQQNPTFFLTNSRISDKRNNMAFCRFENRELFIKVWDIFGSKEFSSIEDWIVGSFTIEERKDCTQTIRDIYPLIKISDANNVFRNTLDNYVL